MSTNNLSKQSIGQNKIRSPAHHPVLSNQPQHQHQFQRSRHSDNAVIDELDHSKCDDTKDLPEERSRRAKPGRLDLRQFDNITTAIGKLNIQPPNPAKLPPKSNDTSYSRRPTNSRHKQHGRAVAPPKLPTATDRSSESTSEISSSQLVMKETSGGIDFSQSPIAQRLLKYSINHKVSEISSPYESDPDIPVSSSGPTRLNNRGLTFNNDRMGPIPKTSFNNMSDTGELITARGETIRQLNEILARPPARPGASPRMNRGASLDQQTDEQPELLDTKRSDREAKNNKKKIRSDEKLEKQRHKEEERLRRLEKKSAAKKSKSLQTNLGLDEDGVPLFIKRCIEFIEYEGLDAEGIYRVPGNRAHVDAFVQKFKDNPNMSIVESDIPVNAVATALKDFLSKKWGPIMPLSMMNELTELSKISDNGERGVAIKQLLNRLPVANYKLLKYVFRHFVRVSLNHCLNSMDSKNLAICWWPTLLPLQFNDMLMFEQTRPHLEESIQTMIDQYEFIFENDKPTSPQV